MPQRCEGRSPAIMFVAAAPCHAVASAKADDCGLLLNPAESASPENNRQSEQNDCDRHERRAGDVSEQDEKDRDDGEDCGEVVVHSFPIVYRVELSAARFLNVIDFARRLFLPYAFKRSTRNGCFGNCDLILRVTSSGTTQKEVDRDETDIAASKETPWVPHHISRSCDHRELCNGAPLSARKGSDQTQLAAAHPGLGIPGSDRG